VSFEQPGGERVDELYELGLCDHLGGAGLGEPHPSGSNERLRLSNTGEDLEASCVARLTTPREMARLDLIWRDPVDVDEQIGLADAERDRFLG
jgi:hypothetical protein